MFIIVLFRVLGRLFCIILLFCNLFLGIDLLMFEWVSFVFVNLDVVMGLEILVCIIVCVNLGEIVGRVWIVWCVWRIVVVMIIFCENSLNMSIKIEFLGIYKRRFWGVFWNFMKGLIFLFGYVDLCWDF